MTGFDFTQVPELRLSRGRHPNPEDGVCFYEAVAFFAGEPHSDQPKCACPVLTSYGIKLNDRMPDDIRNELLVPLIGQVAGTRDGAAEQERTEFLAMWAVNKIAPIALRAQGIFGLAERCEQAKDLGEAKVIHASAASADAMSAAYAAFFARHVANAVAANAVAAVAADAAFFARHAARDAANAAAIAADAAAIFAAEDPYAAAYGVWQVAVDGLRKAILIGRHDGFAIDPSKQLPAFRKAAKSKAKAYQSVGDS